MRRKLALVTLVGAAALGALAGCYSPGDLGDTPFACTPMYPDCPDSYSCQLNANLPNISKCVRASAAGTTMGAPLAVHVDKTGPAYTGPRTSLGLSQAHCPASAFNFNLQSAFTLDGSTASPTVYLCRPDETNVYRVALDGPAQYVRVRVAYAIANGDLDLAFLDGNGAVVAADGSAHDGACLATSAPVSSLDLAVVGARGADTNKYTVVAERSATPLACP